MPFEPRREDELTASAGPPPVRLVLAVARPTGQLDRTLAACRALMLAVGLMTLLACGLALLWVVRRELSPLGHLSQQIAALRPDALKARLPAGRWPAELEPLVARLNEWLARLEEAFERERALAANVAHELRTPLSGLAATLDVALSRPRAAGAYVRTLRECRGICTRTQQLVENLLMLFRLERGRLTLRREPLDLVAELKRAWWPLAEVAKGRRVRVEWQVPAAAPLKTDPALVAVLLSNLLDNAVSYVDAGGTIRIELRMDRDTAELVIAASGCMMSEHAAARVFDRFWRSDQARSDTGLHCGLGLALCRQIVERHGGSLEAAVRPGGWFGVTVRLPGGDGAAK